MRDRLIRESFKKAWPHTPAVRELHLRRQLRYMRLIRRYQCIQRYWESVVAEMKVTA